MRGIDHASLTFERQERSRSTLEKTANDLMQKLSEQIKDLMNHYADIQEMRKASDKTDYLMLAAGKYHEEAYLDAIERACHGLDL